MKLAYKEIVWWTHMAVWMKEDPDATEEFILSPIEHRLRQELTKISLKEWAKSDPERAMRLLDGMTNTMRAREVWTIMEKIAPLARSHRDELVELAQTWPPYWRYQIFETIAKEQWKRDPAGAIEWLASVETSPNPFLRALQVSGGKSLLPYVDLVPEEWLSVAARLCDHGVVGDDPFGWLETDAEELGVDDQVMEKIQLGAAKGLRLGFPKDVATARSLLSNATPSVQKELATRIVYASFRADRKETQEWVATLANPEVRAKAQALLDGLSKREKRLPPPPTNPFFFPRK